ncbi:MAG: hypothetical protein J1E60_03535 [Christensenellaceae bacterium]|nr:hypothetical protein [Christensenellaceae bacterium]
MSLPSWLSAVIFLVIFIAIFAIFAVPMGLSNMLNTMMNTAYQLLIDTTLFIMALAVIMGSVSALLSEFGVVALLNKILSPLMRPIYGLPGASSLVIVTTYLSDNPAILSLADDRGFRKYFKKYQLYALTNLGTAFGMGLIVSTFMIGLSAPSGGSIAGAVLIGNIGAVLGSIVSTRLMLFQTKKVFGKDAWADDLPAKSDDASNVDNPTKQKKNIGMRIINSILEGGSSGVQVGLSIIPGVLIICTIVMMLTNGGSEGGYTGAAYEGVAFIPKIANALGFIIKPLFGFASFDAIAVPITALGSAGAAMGLVPSMLAAGKATVHDIAVFTAMCMCWSGYLSTHVSMMQSLGRADLSGKAIVSHTIGGLFAGVAANWLFKLFELIV